MVYLRSIHWTGFAIFNGIFFELLAKELERPRLNGSGTGISAACISRMKLCSLGLCPRLMAREKQ